MKYIAVCRTGITRYDLEVAGPFDDQTAAEEFMREEWKHHGHNGGARKGGELTSAFPSVTGLNGAVHFVLPLMEPQ